MVGNIGSYPIAGTAVLVSCPEVTGSIFVASSGGPSAACQVVNSIGLLAAVGDMGTAFTAAAGLTTPDFINLGAGDITGKTLVPGLYKWSTDLLVSAAGVTLSGGPNAVWIFQIAGDLTLANNAHIILAGGASPNNIFWQVGASNLGAVLGTGSVMYGTILSAKQVIENTGATLVGRALAQTQVTLQSTSITTPGPLVGGIPALLAPTVTSTVPANIAVGVPIGNTLSATFSEAMNPTTLNAATFTLQNGLTLISGAVAYVGLTATFTPSSALPANTLLTATLTTGAADPSGVSLAANYVWTFTTGAGPSLTLPTVSSTFPASGALSIPTNSSLAATFSEAMNPVTITTSTFSLARGAIPVAGTVTYAGVVATFTPAASLAPGVVFTATITTGVADLAGNHLASIYNWNFTSGAAPDLTAPTVSSTVPVSGALSVPVNNALAATFSKSMNAATISTATFTLTQGATPVAGTVTYAGVIATFTPLAGLAPNLPFTATITTAVMDLAGNHLATNYVWSFTTGATPSLTPPTVVATVPAGGATDVPIGNTLAATFSEAINPLTINTTTFNLKQGATPVTGTVSYVGVTAIFTPSGNLTSGTVYTATITTGVTDLFGNVLASNYVWSFTTGSVVVNLTPPVVSSTTPASGAAAVTVSSNITAVFSEPMNPLTISTATFYLQQGTLLIPGSVTYVGVSATFRPTYNLVPNTTYSVRILGSVADLSGNPMGATYLWNFTTGAAGNQTPVCLANFALLSGSAVINSGNTLITGDVGVTPGGAVTGFPPGTIRGTVYTGTNANVTLAMTDITAAFADAVGRSVGPVPVSGDLGGQTLTSGLYKSASSLQIAGGDLTLDAKGDVNAVFIFQMASSFTTTVVRKVVLAGGAQAFNVFWQVGTSATLGANSVLNGSILAGQSITLNPGATVNGRLAALAGSITLQSSVVASPPPSIAVGAVFNAASYSNTVSAGSIASVFGNNFSSSVLAATAYPLLPSLGETGFQVGSLPGPLYMISCGQTNLQIPWQAEGQAPVIATVAGLVSTTQTANIVPFSPGIFTINQSGSGQGAVEVAATGQLAGPTGPGSSPVARGQYIAIYCTGLGAVTNEPATGAAASSSPLSYTITPPTVTIGGVAATVTFSGLAPGFAGLYQVNALVPTSVTPGNAVNVVMSIAGGVGLAGVQSNTVTIAIQ